MQIVTYEHEIPNQKEQKRSNFISLVGNLNIRPILVQPDHFVRSYVHNALHIPESGSQVDSGTLIFLVRTFLVLSLRMLA